jgi:hypothetical protein
VINFGSSDGDPVRILWVAADESLDGYGAIVSPHLNGFALVPGCQGPLSKWGGGFGCSKTTPVRRLNIFGPNFGRITIRGPGYEGVGRDDSEPTFGMNAGSLWWNPPFHDPSRTWNNQGSYAAPVVAGASYTVEGLRWLPDSGQPGDIIIEFSDPHASQSLGNAAEAVTLTLVTDRGQVTCTAAADSDRRFFASGQTGPETGAALGDCGQKFRLLAGQADATTLERAHRRRRRQYVPVQQVSVEPAGECDYGELPELAVEEGNDVGAQLPLASKSECQAACDRNPACNSLSFCPQWGCWMKDRSFSGAEATKSHYGCQTYYKKTCTDVDTPESPTETPVPTRAPTIAPTSASTPAPTDAQTGADTGANITRSRLLWRISGAGS